MNNAMHLAQINVARLTYGPDDKRSAGFMRNLDMVNAIAESAPGFVWRLKDESGNATDLQGFADPNIIANMSVWENAETFEHFVWQSVHKTFYAKREKWFDRANEAQLAIWWIEPGRIPTLQDGIDRLEHLRRNGASDHAFGWERLPNVRMWLKQRCA